MPEIQPAAEKLEYLGDRKFKLTVRWDTQQPAPKKLAVFVHFFKPQTSRLHKDGFYGMSQADAAHQRLARNRADRPVVDHYDSP